MDAKNTPEFLGGHGHRTIVVESTAKGQSGHCPRQQGHQRQQKKLATVRIVLVTALVLGLVGLGVSISNPTAIWWRIPCHEGVVAKQDSSKMEAASTETLQDPLPGLHQHEAVQADHDTAGPMPSTFRRLRRQDNSTTSSAPPSSTSVSTSAPPSSTTPPPATSTTSSASSTSSPPPPPPSTSSTTPPPPPPPTTSAPPPPPPPPPPSSQPPLTTIPGTSSDSVSNNRLPTSSASVPLVSSGNGNGGGGVAPAPSPTPAPSPPVPTKIDVGTIITRLTTLDRSGVSTVVEVPVTIPAQTSRVVLKTLTSTRPNGEIVVVTQTSYVPADPAMTGDPFTANEPSLHNGASGKGVGGVAVGVMVGAMLGAALLV